MSNRLIKETSPYLLQHANNPVQWFPWCKEAFDKADIEDKPIFLSIGYSTCHWCHVMAHESFENENIAEILNKYFISIKVDKEQRPDVDSIYMTVCQAFTGSGGWPTSIFMTAEQKPFFAGTYFPKTSRYGMIGFKEVLLTIQEQWQSNRSELLSTANQITAALQDQHTQAVPADEILIDVAIKLYKQSFDEKFGGFGDAPKFPAPHNLLFLLQQNQKNHDLNALEMAEKTLLQMYRGGIFDHIGYGFCRYSTDRYFLVPHFEKMLYDNALLVLAYCKAFEITRKKLYLDIAEKTAFYILTEMTSSEGGFYSAQDADSDGIEGKYYVFEPNEIIMLLGKINGDAFNKAYSITVDGNFEGKSIPNLLHTHTDTDAFAKFLPLIRTFRHNRCSLHTDEKFLTLWNALVIAALCSLYQVSRKHEYLTAAKRAQNFIETRLCNQETLYVSYQNGEQGVKGLLDDYSFYSYALLKLYDATLDEYFLNAADEMVAKTVSDFFDVDSGGFYLYGRDNERLIFRPKESYDGAIPSGNSMIAYNLVRLNVLKPNQKKQQILQKQIDFISTEAQSYPIGYGMALSAISDFFKPTCMITVILKNKEDIAELTFKVPLESNIKVLKEPTKEYGLLNDQTTYYICDNYTCHPPTNKLPM